jgi:hypothetical protein
MDSKTIVMRLKDAVLRGLITRQKMEYMLNHGYTMDSRISIVALSKKV